MTNNIDKADVQKKYMELQMVHQQVQQVQKQVQAIENQVNELELVLQALDEFQLVPKGSDAFVTLTPGIFIKATIQETDSVLVNIGSNTAAQKTIPQTKQLIAGQSAELQKLRQELAEQLEKLTTHAGKLQESLKALVKEHV